MYQKQLDKSGKLTGILRTEDGASIPLAEGNTDYANYLEWVAAGNEPADDPSFTLEGSRASKNAEINAARLAANRGPFMAGGLAFACDELSRSDIDGINGYVSLFDAMPAGWPGYWKAVDNTHYAIANVADWKAFYTCMVATGNANFAKAQGLKAQLAAATTIEQIKAIAWEN